MRKLAIVCGAFSAAVFLANYILPADWLLPMALSLWLSGTALVLLRRRWILPLILALCAAAFGLFCFRLHAARTVELAHGLNGSTQRGSYLVLTRSGAGDGYASAEIELLPENGGRLRARLYDRSGTLAKASPGDRVSGSIRVWSADVRNGDRYDGDTASGIYLRANNLEELELVPNDRLFLRGLPSAGREWIRSRIRSLFPDDTAALFQALMLGDKTELYQDESMQHALSRAGIMHMVAVSGMHIAVLVGMLLKLFGNTRRSAVLCLLIVWSYVLMTGSGPSALRAAIMQSVVLIAPLLGRENDPPTTLLFALALILLGNPHAAGSISLQLSFSAVAGILIFSDRLHEAVSEWLPKRTPFRLKNYLSSTAAVSLSVLVFSVPLSGLYFGYVSVLAPLTNLLVMWAVPICFGGGFLACLLTGLFLPAGEMLAWLVSWLARFIVRVAGIVSGFDFSCLYLCLGVNILWLAFVYVLYIAAALIPGARWKKWLYPTGIAVFSIFVLLTATRMYYAAADGYVAAVDVGQGQSLVAFSGDRTVVVDCGGVNALRDAGDSTGGYLSSRGRQRIDLLVLTHLHLDHANGVQCLLEYMPVDKIILAEDVEDPNGLLPLIRQSAQRHGTRIETIGRDTLLREGDIQIMLFAPCESGEINERCLTGKISIGDYDMLVTADIGKAEELELLDAYDLSGIDLLVVSHHGSRFGSSCELLRGTGAQLAVISSGYNTYGHPAEETLERLADCGYTVYRTDQCGTVEIRIS